MSKIPLVLLSILGAGLAVGCNSANKPTATPARASTTRHLLNLANEKLMQPRESESALRAAWNAPGSDDDRVEAGVRLANVMWRIHHRPDEARTILQGTQKIGARPALPLTEVADLEISEKTFAAARQASRNALEVASNICDKRLARTSFGQSVREEFFESTLRSNASTRLDDASVREAFEILRPLIADEPGWRDPSRSQVLLALLLGDGASALRAWESYFLVIAATDWKSLARPASAPSTAPEQSERTEDGLAWVDGKWELRPLQFTEPGKVLARVLPGFTNDADEATRTLVVRSLAGSRLYSEAAALALHWKLKCEGRVRDIIVYARWLDRLTREFSEAYRQHALGKNYYDGIALPGPLDFRFGKSRLEKILYAEGPKLRRELDPKSKPFEMTDFMIGLRIQFGVVSRTLDPDTFSFIHGVREEDPLVEQYGRKKTMHVTMTDSPACNSFVDWLTGERASGLGGWAGNDSFVVVSNEFSLSMWEALNDPDIYRRYLKENLELLEAEDRSREKSRPDGYFPGLALRMLVRSNEKLLAQLKASGLSGRELRTAFIRERERRVTTWLIAHEGRHVLDAGEPVQRSSADYEFHAKCSEVAFSLDPQLTMNSIFSPNIEHPELGGHSAANARVMKLLLAWMQSHADEIEGLDHSRALLPQFDRLTDDQMREAFRSFDPWVRPETNSSRP